MTFIQRWRDTAWGKFVEDYFWYVVAAVAVAFLNATSAWLTDNQVRIEAALGPWGLALFVALAKSVNYLLDKLRDPKVPNTPE